MSVIFQVEFDGFLEVCESFLLGATECGDVVVGALDYEIRVIAVEGVVNLSYG